MAAHAGARERTGLIDRYSALFISVAAAMWAADAYFRPALTRQLSASQIVLVEDLLISLCFLPLTRRVAGELRRASWRTWLGLTVIGVGPQAIATVLFTQSISIASAVPSSESPGVLSEVYLLYLLQPVFGAGMAWLILRERRRRSFWPVAGLALGGAAMIIFATNAAAPQAQLTAAAYVLGAVVLWGLGTVVGRYALGGVSFATTSAMRFVIALPVLLVLLVATPGSGGFSGYSVSQLPALLGIALIPGLIAMVLYYRALSSTRASVSSFAELGYPAALFLVFSLPAPYGYAVPIQPLEVAGAVVLVVAVTSLNLMMRRDVITGSQPRQLRLAAEPSGQ